MSLSFGIYLVEQRIISPEQFCGLVKIQQGATISMATIAIKMNLMTMKQVSRVMDLVEAASDLSFVDVAVEEKLIDRSDAQRMINLQQSTCPRIRELVVECGLLTTRQSNVLFAHFTKQARLQDKLAEQPEGETASQPEAAPAEPVIEKQAPRQPKFTQRPVIVQPYTGQISQ